MLNLSSTQRRFFNAVSNMGGISFLVGGAVIDLLEGRTPKDLDFEIFGLSFKTIERQLLLMELPVSTVGQSFGVIKTVMDGEDIDLSLPRTENKIGVGHTGFDVFPDPTLDVETAARRRDLTINAISVNVLTGEIVDPFNGREDLANGVLRATDPETFVQDPLRVLRIMQLLPRKGRVVAPETVELCRKMVNTFHELPKERVFTEWEKLLLKADRPSMGLEFLRDCGWLAHFPELSDLIGCEQNPEWHPEGDVWTHTCMVLDNAAQLRDQLPEEDRLTFMLAALLHDVGKPSTTTPDLSAHGHDAAGVPLAVSFLERMTNNSRLMQDVPNLVGLHMRPGQLTSSNAGDGAWKRLSRKVDMNVLGFLSKADSAGRTGRNVMTDVHRPSELCFEWAQWEEFEPILKGRDLLALGLTPGPVFGEILNFAFELQMDGNENREELLSLCRREFSF